MNNEPLEDTKENLARRSFLKTASAISVMGVGANFLVPGVAPAVTLTKGKRDAMTADEVIAMMKEGNKRFRNRQSHAHNYLHEQRDVSSGGQYPAAVILSCIDSRAPAEILMDLGIGDVFNIRIAGNVSNSDVIGSMEFACKLAGAKVVLVMGHTRCGAVKGAIQHAQLGNLTGLLNKVAPAIAATTSQEDPTSYAYVDAVARTHVKLTAQRILEESSILKEMAEGGEIKVVSSMYDIQNGILEFFA